MKREEEPIWPPNINNAVRKECMYHKPGPGGLAKIAMLRQAYSDLAGLVEVTVTNSRERSVALTELATSRMWAISGVVLNDPESEIDPDNAGVPLGLDATKP